MSTPRSGEVTELMPQVKNKPDRDVVEEVAEHLNPHPFRKVVQTACAHVAESGVGNTRIACDLHRLVRSEVEYVDYPNFRHPPREALEEGANCVDATGLLCSLLIRAGFSCRITLVAQATRGHMFPEVLLQGSIDSIQAEIQSYYENHRFRPPTEIAYDPADAVTGYWVVVDPATDNYLGGTTGLCRLGYLDRPTDGQPQFNGTVERFGVEYDRH